MGIGRAILALLISLAVAMLPVGGIAASGGISSTSNLATSATDCCDHDSMAIDKMMMKDCQAAAGCASKCFSLFSMNVSSPMIHPPMTEADGLFATEFFRPLEGNPPFRPPRV